MVRVREAYRMKRLGTERLLYEMSESPGPQVTCCLAMRSTISDGTLWGPWCKRSYVVGWTTANALLAETADIQIKRLQSVPNTAARLVSGQQHHCTPT